MAATPPPSLPCSDRAHCAAAGLCVVTLVVFCAGLAEADANQNNGGVPQKPAATDSTGAEGPRQPWSPASTADPDEATPRPHLARLFSRDAPGREDNTFKERPSESDELQTIQEHSGAASDCGSENPDEDLE